MDNIILTNEWDEDICFEFLDLVEYMHKKYVILLPVEDQDEAGIVEILKIESINDREESYKSVESDEELQAVISIFRERNKDVFDFLD